MSTETDPAEDATLPTSTRDVVRDAIYRASHHMSINPDQLIDHIADTVMEALGQFQGAPESGGQHVTVAEIEEMFAANDDFTTEVVVRDANGKNWIIARTQFQWLSGYGVRHDPKLVYGDTNTPSGMSAPLTLLTPATARTTSEDEIRGQEIAHAKAELLRWRKRLLADGWDEGVVTALNYAIRNDDGITLRLEHLDGRPIPNPHRAEADGETDPAEATS